MASTLPCFASPWPPPQVETGAASSHILGIAHLQLTSCSFQVGLQAGVGTKLMGPACRQAMDALFKQQAECHRHEQPRKSKKHGKRRFILFEMWPLTVRPHVCTAPQDQSPTWIQTWPLTEQANTTWFLCAFWLCCTAVWQQLEPVQRLLLQHNVACLCRESRQLPGAAVAAEPCTQAA